MANKRFGRGAKSQQPAGAVRRSQVISTFGPGCMMDLVDKAVLVGGLEHWRGEGSVLREPRLADRLLTRLRAINRELSPQDPFRFPPAGLESPSPSCGINVMEFPEWMVCQGCRGLVKARSLEEKNGRYVHGCARTAQLCVPVRFVSACKRGHLSEFPWYGFVHAGQERHCDRSPMRLIEGRSGDFSQIRVKCDCGATRRLSDAYVMATAPQCTGERPWLGSEHKEECQEKLRLLVRTASNAYFALKESALVLPDPDNKLDEAVRNHIQTLKDVTADTLPAFRTAEPYKSALAGFSHEAVLAAIEARRLNKTPQRGPVRTSEFQLFTASADERIGELPGEDDKFFARRWVGKTTPGVAKIVLSPRLREIEVLIGFTRLEPLTPDLEGEFDLNVMPAALSATQQWLPATEILGEGIFLQLDEGALCAWERRDSVRAHEENLRRAFDLFHQDYQDPPQFPGARYYLVHSLAHLLMTSMSLTCGYTASAMKERIYCAPADYATPMAAVLISTGSAGSEGTLGGLVNQGRHMDEHLRRAWDLGTLCSNDPVCAAHVPTDVSERYLEGAACHACLFVAESSCERFNRFLDRSLVVPTLGTPGDLAFFTERP